MMNMLFCNINGVFVIANHQFLISFNKNHQELFYILKNFNINELWVLTGPGSFIGTRSVMAFSQGYIFNTNIRLKGFNLLIDILPLTSKINVNNKLFFINESNRFFYCIKEEDLPNRNFFLIDFNQLNEYKNVYFLVGNHEIAHEYIQLNGKIIFNIINSVAMNINHTLNIEYCGKFLI